MALKRSAGGTHLMRRRQLGCMSCNTFLSMVETAIHTEVVAGSA
ncbi:MAG TPA: hypothetical protein VGJ79_05085 [Candidatus Dormibacteraeota bacterium]|jgi:hypothetical protein